MKTQREMILNHLLTGEPITDRVARDNYHCSRLADVIFKIRKRYPVDTHLISHLYPSGARSKFAVYSMPRSVIEAYRSNKAA